MYEWKRLQVALAVAIVWAVSVASSEISRVLGRPGEDGVDVIGAVILALVVLAMMSERGGWPPWKRVAFVPAAFLMHVALTVPSAGALGVLMYSPDHVRSIGEQRAVFLLAAVPVLYAAMRRSRLFVREVSSLPRDSSD